MEEQESGGEGFLARLIDGEQGRVFFAVLFWIYLAILLRITVFREDFSLTHLMENGKLNLALFTAYAPFLRGRLIGLFVYLFVGNILWFIPLGAYLVWRGGTVRKAVLTGFLLSLSIEILQYVFGVGVTEVDDLVLNTFGTLLGAAAVSLIRRIRRRGSGGGR